MNTSKLWISLLEVEALPENKVKDYKKAYVNGLIMAESAEEAVTLLKDSLNKMGWDLLSSEDTDEYEKRVLEYEVSPEIKEFAQIVYKTGMPQFGTFHSWE
ncbi:MAG: hypothetical protein H8D23_30190 [Candidatus Brocadiales bacterium]|nr:hypothetical protein [Candidatus Brocadiales bacterium]